MCVCVIGHVIMFVCELMEFDELGPCFMYVCEMGFYVCVIVCVCDCEEM